MPRPASRSRRRTSAAATRSRKGQYIQVEDEELEKIQIESTHTIDIESFVPRAEIDDRYLDSPYYIAPTDQVGQEAFAVIRDTIAREENGRRSAAWC